jgi:hypothetical protein
MLSAWSESGVPGAIQLHLLQNPVGLFDALKEQFSEEFGAQVESVKLDCRFMDVTFPVMHSETFEQTRQKEIQEKIKLDGGSKSVGPIYLSNIYLQHARWNSALSSLQFVSNTPAFASYQVLREAVKYTYDAVWFIALFCVLCVVCRVH